MREASVSERRGSTNPGEEAVQILDVPNANFLLELCGHCWIGA